MELLEERVKENTEAIGSMQGIINHQQSTLETICANVSIIASGHMESNKLLKELHEGTAEIVGLMKTAKGMRAAATFTTPFFLLVTAAMGAVAAVWAFVIHFIKEPR